MKVQSADRVMSRQCIEKKSCPLCGAPAPLGNGRLYFNFLLVGIGLLVVVHIPTQRDEKLVDEVLAGLGFLVVGG